MAYVILTPEGRLVRDRALVALFPPELPTLSGRQRAMAAVAAPRYHGPVMALAYHGIGSSSDGEGGFIISVARFGEHLATLKAAGMHAVTAAQVAEAFTGGAPLPPNAVMISFDDGRTDAMMFADPLLRQAGMSATMFVIAGAASKPGVYYASWDKIESYARSGRWDIQSHTAVSHREHQAAGGESLPLLTSLAPGESLTDYRTRIRGDLSRAAAAIRQHVGRRPLAFAYPFGAYGADRTNDPAIATVLREEVARQYAIAFQQDEQDTVPLMTADHDRLLLRRVEVENWSGLELLARIERARQALGGAGPPPGPPPAPGPDPGSSQTVVIDYQPSPGSPSTGGTAASAANAPAADSRASAPSSVPQSQTGTPTVVSIVPPVAVTAPPTPVTTFPVTTPTSTVPTTTRPPITSPPTTTGPPATSPPTTACRTAGKSGQCPPGRS
ncbi:MAG: polysaccharide deacetylase family protein [Actinomycetota bacterium]|nr:polysaccharide deacetylase family protein [Actinomycetota bacterium]